MTREEYMEKLVNMVGEEETLIPEKPEESKEEISNGSTENNPVDETPVDNSEGSAEETSNGSAEESSGSNATDIEQPSQDKEEDDGTPINPQNGKKYSNKKIKKTIWENKHLANEVAELKRQLAEMQQSREPKANATLKRPSKADFASEEEYQDAVFGYNMSLLAQRNKADMEARTAKIREVEQQQREFVSKVEDTIPEAKRDEFVNWIKSEGPELSKALSEKAEQDMMSMSTAPLIAWKLGKSPDLVSHVNRMNNVERILFYNELANQMKSELGGQIQAPKPAAKAPVIGKVGTGKPASTDLNSMSDDEWYNEMQKRISG